MAAPIGEISLSNADSTNCPTAAPTVNLRQLCARFAKPHLGRAAWQLVNTLVPFAALWALMAWSVVGEWGYGWTLLMALPTAGLYVRTFIIQHDCGHGSYFADARMNDLVGRCPADMSHSCNPRAAEFDPTWLSPAGVGRRRGWA